MLKSCRTELTKKVFVILISRLGLTNFRNYEKLELRLRPGTTIIRGKNAQGKSNLLEAIYMLALSKSPRAANDGDLIRRAEEEHHIFTQVSGTVSKGDEVLQVQIGFTSETKPKNGPRQGSPSRNSRKFIRVNGFPKRPVELIGIVNAVMFSAPDLEMIYGSPSVRRRYLDVLVSQFDRDYLGALQRYRRVLRQRNHLLKRIREGRASSKELSFWDKALVKEGTTLIAGRAETVEALSTQAGLIHRDLSSIDEKLALLYHPDIPWSHHESAQGLRDAFLAKLESHRSQELAQGVTVCGPHRDDLILLVEGLEASVYASRGQARTAVLSMRLAEAAYLRNQCGHHPILLLDDVLSELDDERRGKILGRVMEYEQCLVTTTDVDFSVGDKRLADATVLEIQAGSVTPSGRTDPPS